MSFHGEGRSTVGVETTAQRQKLRALINNELFMPAALLVLIIIVNVILQPTFFRLRIIRSNLATFAPLMLVSAGQAIIILSGKLDLSVGAGISLINCILADTMSDNPAVSLLALLLAFGVALAAGSINGLVVGYLKLPSLIATFATSAIWFGIALFLRPQPGGYMPPWVIKFYRFHIGVVTTSLLMVVVMMLVWWLIRKRRLGRYIYAVGSNAEAAFDSGVNTKRVILGAYIIGWVFTFMASFSITAQMSSGDAYMGTPFTLNSVAAVVIGGVALGGGRGSVLGAVFGAVILSLVLNIIYFAKIPSIYQEFVKGAIIVVALALTLVYKRQKRT